MWACAVTLWGLTLSPGQNRGALWDTQLAGNGEIRPGPFCTHREQRQNAALLQAVSVNMSQHLCVQAAESQVSDIFVGVYVGNKEMGTCLIASHLACPSSFFCLPKSEGFATISSNSVDAELQW